MAHLLHVCGLYLGDERDLVPASEANPDGYWEHRQFIAVNDELLRVLGGDWSTPVSIPAPSSPEWTRHTDLRGVVTQTRALRDAFTGHEPWGWKDPRSSLTLPFWLSQIPDLKVVACVRHPLEVAASLKRLDPNASIATGVARWTASYERLLADAPVHARLLTHAGSYFSAPEAELRRLIAFAGLEPGADAFHQALAIVRPDLRRNRFTSDEVAGFDLSPQVLDLYGRLCEEAGWDEARARSMSSVGALHAAVAIEEHDRLFAARAAHTRQIASTDARLREQEERFRQELDRRDDELLRALQAGTTVRGFHREFRQQVEYRRMVRNLRRVVGDVVPPGRPMLVINRGDEETLVGPGAASFPQGPDGAYAGYYPASSLGAIAHLEALRARGAEFLVVPTTELWWLEQYEDFGRHVRKRYRVRLEDPWSCTIFALREVPPTRDCASDQFVDSISACEELLQREPAILDWGTGWRLASTFPERTVFSPPAEDIPLPYLDRSVDVVAVPAAFADRVAEAERMASAAVIVVPAAADSSESVTTRWIAEGAGHLPTVSLIVAVPDSQQDSSPLLRSLEETVPKRFNAQVVTAGDLNSGAARATGEIFVFLESNTVALPGWLAPLLRLFRDRPQAGVAGGKVLAVDGRLEHGGGVVAAGMTLRNIEEDEYAAGGPASEVVRHVDWCSPALLATHRDLFRQLGGFDEQCFPVSYAVADYCRRVRELGREVLFQPEASVVRVGLSPDLGNPAPTVAPSPSPEERIP